jgi:hypothetical protein
VKFESTDLSKEELSNWWFKIALSNLELALEIVTRLVCFNQAVGQSDPNIFQEPKTVAPKSFAESSLFKFFAGSREHAW